MPILIPRRLLRLLSTASMLTVSLLPAGCGDISGSYDKAPPYEPLVAVAGDATLQLYNPAGQSWLQPVGLGLGANWLLPREDELYAVNSISHSLQRIVQDSTGIHTHADLDLGLDRNTSPYAAAFCAGRIVVTNLLANSVSIISPDDFAITGEFPAGRAPEGMITFDGECYVINTGYDFSDFSFHTGSIYRMDITDGAILDSLTLGVNPQFGARGLSGELHIVCTGDYQSIMGQIWVLASNPLELMHIIEIGHSPGRIAMDYPDEIAYLAAGGWSNEGSEHGLILRYNLRTGEILSPLDAGLGVVDVCYDELRNALYAVCRDAMRLDIFENGEHVASLPLTDPPNAITVAFE